MKIILLSLFFLTISFAQPKGASEVLDFLKLSDDMKVLSIKMFAKGYWNKRLDFPDDRSIANEAMYVFAYIEAKHIRTDLPRIEKEILKQFDRGGNIHLNILLASALEQIYKENIAN